MCSLSTSKISAASFRLIESSYVHHLEFLAQKPEPLCFQTGILPIELRSTTLLRSIQHVVFVGFGIIESESFKVPRALGVESFAAASLQECKDLASTCFFANGSAYLSGDSRGLQNRWAV